MKSSKAGNNQEAINKVLKMLDEDLKELKKSSEENTERVNRSVAGGEELLKKLGVDFSSLEAHSIKKNSNMEKPIILDNWENIADEAEQQYPNPITIEELFTGEELRDNQEYIKKLRNEFKDINKLDRWDYTVAGIVGTIAALIDYFLVTQVSASDHTVIPGKLKSGVESFWNKILPAEKIAQLERNHKVPFDISTNTSKLSQEVLGLNPNHHRFQSLGHDPLLGFVFGVKDLMKGEMTAIDGNGRFIIQAVSGHDGMKFTEAVITEFGHLLSDVSAPSKTGMILSVPAPLTPLLQLIQKGSISYKGKVFTVADLSKRMYYDGYNFNHFIGMSVPVVILQILIRLYTVMRELFSEDYESNKNKTDLLLFIANGILFAENMGKFVITRNLFAINYVSWIETARYTLKTMNYALVKYHIEEIGHIETIIDDELTDMYENIENTWDEFTGNRPVLYL